MRKISISYEAMTSKGQQKLTSVDNKPQVVDDSFKTRHPDVYKKACELSKRTIEEEKTKCQNQKTLS